MPLLPAYYVAQAAAAAREQLHGNKEAAPSPGQLQPPGPAQMSLTLSIFAAYTPECGLWSGHYYLCLYFCIWIPKYFKYISHSGPFSP